MTELLLGIVPIDPPEWAGALSFGMPERGILGMGLLPVGSAIVHEAGAVAAAIDEAFDTWPALASDGRMAVRIVDPTRAEANAVEFYARALLSELGLDGMTLSVRTDPVECELCGAASAPTPVEPCCEACGAPLPRAGGPAIICQPDDDAVETRSGRPRCA